MLEQVRTRRPLHLPARYTHPRDRPDELSWMRASPTLLELVTRRSLASLLTGTREKNGLTMVRMTRGSSFELDARLGLVLFVQKSTFKIVHTDFYESLISKSPYPPLEME